MKLLPCDSSSDLDKAQKAAGRLNRLGPVGGVRVGRLDGQFIINPDSTELENLELNLIVAGTADAVIMVEGGGAEVSEETLIEAIDFAHHTRPFGIQLILRIVSVSGIPFPGMGVVFEGASFGFQH